MIMKDVIPCAGVGQRLKPLSLAVPKELLPIGIKPAIDYHVQDLVNSGIDQIIIITNNSKPQIRSYLEYVSPDYHFTFVCQQTPNGLGFARLEAREEIGNDPFVLLLPDNMFFGSTSLSQALLRTHQCTGLSCVTLFKSGTFKPGAKMGYHVKKDNQHYDMVSATFDLKGPKEGENLYFGPAAMLLTPEVFPLIDRHSLNWDSSLGEYSERPALKDLVTDSKLAVAWVDGECFDIGTPQGYEDCVRFWALQQA